MTRILIVDDKEENLAYLQALLTSLECTVDAAHHGAEALLKARQTQPDLIISDLLMPVMDGYTLLRHWKTDPRLQDIPFIVYTATYIDPDDERLALNLGADAFILKPTDPEALLARLREVLARAASASPLVARLSTEDEGAQLKLYNDRLIRKLEEKTLQLEAANHSLREDIAARIRSEQVAERALQRLNDAQRIGQIGDWEWMPATETIVWSPQVFEILGRDPVVGPPRSYNEYASIFDEENRAILAASIDAAITTGTLQTHELTLSREDRGRVQLHGVVVPRRDEDGRVVNLHGTIQDITATRRIEEALSGSERRYRELFENMLEGYAYCRAIIDGGRMVDFVYLEVNEAFVKLTGLKDVIGKRITDLIPDAYVRSPATIEIYERAVLTGVPERHEIFVEVLDAWLSLAIYSADREHFVVVFDNITERKRSEEALRASEQEFRELAEAMPQIVWVTDPEGQHTHFNQHWSDYTGLTLPESLGHGWNPAFHPDDQQGAAAQWKQATRSGEPYEIEHRLRRADGVYRWMLGRALPLRDNAGRIVKWFGTCTDIHDLKLAELEITRVNRALKVLSTCNEAMIRAEGEPELLDRICRIAVETGGYHMAWVGYAQDDGVQSIKPVAHAGVEDGYLSEIKVSWNEHDPQGQGPAGRVIRTGKAAVCADFSSDPAVAHWQPMAARRGFRGLILLPLRDRHHTFGFLGLYSAEVNEPGGDELKLLQDLADNLAFGIVHLRARVGQQRLQNAVIKVAAAVSATTGGAFYEQLARNMAEALGAQAGFVSQLFPGGPPSASTLAAVVDGTVIDDFEYVIEGTPCENLAASDSFVIARDVVKQFPQAERLAALGAQAYAGRRLDSSTGQSLGHLFVVFREPLEDTAFVTSTMRIFAARAASELERAQTDAQVREQAALIDESHDAIVVRDMDHRVTFWSKGAERLYGWSAKEALGSFFHELLAANPAMFAEADRAVREKGEWSGEIPQEARNSIGLTLNGRWTLLRDADGQQRSILSIDTDITEQKKIEAQFLRAQRLESIGTLAGGIAHDLNNVLAPILMSLDLLNLKFPDPASRELIGIVGSSARRGADMVRQVLSFSRGVEGRRVEVGIKQLILEIEKIANDTFLKQVEIWTVFPKDLWTVTGDPTQIHQVLLNLCVNARDAMPEGGRLKISAENLVLDMHHAARIPGAQPGPHVFLQVEDTGTGMPAEVVAQIFDPFFTTKELGKGTGLGLSTTLAIVKSHGGFIDVDSQPGKGTTFSLYLPAQTEPSAQRLAEAATEMPCGNEELILVVDDEISVREITRQSLEAYGYRVVLATDGADALGIFATHGSQVAAVVTDLMMPGIDGVAVIRALRRLNPELPIIAVTGLPGGGSTVEATSLGVRHFLAKPYSVETLLQMLRDVLGG